MNDTANHQHDLRTVLWRLKSNWAYTVEEALETITVLQNDAPAPMSAVSIRRLERVACQSMIDLVRNRRETATIQPLGGNWRTLATLMDDLLVERYRLYPEIACQSMIDLVPSANTHAQAHACATEGSRCDICAPMHSTNVSAPMGTGAQGTTYHKPKAGPTLRMHNGRPWLYPEPVDLDTILAMFSTVKDTRDPR